MQVHTVRLVALLAVLLVAGPWWSGVPAAACPDDACKLGFDECEHTPSLPDGHPEKFAIEQGCCGAVKMLCATSDEDCDQRSMKPHFIGKALECTKAFHKEHDESDGKHMVLGKEIVNFGDLSVCIDQAKLVIKTANLKWTPLHQSMMKILCGEKTFKLSHQKHHKNRKGGSSSRTGTEGGNLNTDELEVFKFDPVQRRNRGTKENKKRSEERKRKRRHEEKRQKKREEPTSSTVQSTSNDQAPPSNVNPNGNL
jgi:hypothetical protein